MTGSKLKCLRWLEQQPEGEYEVKRVRRKRTLTQNSYYWALVHKLATALSNKDHTFTNDEIHFQMLRDYSRPAIFAAMDGIDAQRYWKYAEKDDHDGQQGVTYWKFYQGSSTMDTKDFKQLLDGLIQECKAVGIETATPEELALMRRE